MKAIRTRHEKTIIFLAAILLQLAASAQSSDSIIEKFEHYNSQRLQEKAFVHTDKSFYLTGEIIWFKVYVTDAIFHKPLDISKIIYVEIINKDNKAVLQAKIEINSGSGNGSLMLPSFLNTGSYTIRAYTNWMKNFDPQYFFEKYISIVNTLKNAGTITNDTNSFSVQFFPEGGQMVNGLQTTVAFHFTDRYGMGMDGKGYLLNQRNDTILQFSPHHFGIGRFSFVPKKGDRYKGVIRFGRNEIATKQLPSAYDEGYVMKLSEPYASHIKVVVACNIDSNNSAYLFIHTRGRYKTMVQQAIINGEAVFVVDKKALDDGINHFTVFNANRQPVCERLYFKRPVKKLDFDISVKQKTFSPRTKVDLELITHQQQVAVSDADLSISAFLIDSLQGIDEPGFLSYLLLTSDVPGHVQDPDWYLNNNTTETGIALDNLMLTHGWRRFKWEEILKSQKPYFDFLPEMEGTVVTGKVFNKTSGFLASNIIAYLTVPGHDFRFANSVSNSKGDLLFNVRKFYGANQFIAQTNVRVDSNYRVDITNPFSDKSSNLTNPPLLLSRKWIEQLRNRNIYAQSENAYLKKIKQQYIAPGDADTSRFYGKPDKTYILDDYTRFTTMEEVMREFVTEVRVRKPSAYYDFKVKAANSLYFDGDPLILLDGVPVFNLNKIMEMDPLKLKRIDIMKHKYFSGSYITHGIVSYSSYDGDLAGYQLDPNSVVVGYEGLQRQREFYSPIYNSSEKLNSRVPDFRNVLYWSPSLKTAANGQHTVSFYTSDLPGTYAIIVQGITPEGLAGSKILTFKIE